MTKTRKPQSDLEYQSQLQAFYTSGPHINSENWLEESLADVSPDQKTDRVRILHACEQAYYRGQYEKCLQLIAKGEQVFGVSDYLIESVANGEDQIHGNDIHDSNQHDNDGGGGDVAKVRNPLLTIASKKIRKSARIERHVVELLKIKQRCVARINSDN